MTAERDEELVQRLKGILAGEQCAEVGPLEGRLQLLGESLSPLKDSPEPSAGLLDRTLDRCLAPAGAELDEASGVIIPFRRRSSVALLLTEDPFALPRLETPSRARLVLRVLSQIAASILIFITCGVFWAHFLPAYTEAKEARQTEACHAKLRRLWSAVQRFQKEQPNSEALRGADLRARLVRFGYADPTDFHCPARPSDSLNRSHFGAFLPPAGSGQRLPVFWDRFNNHVDTLNVLFSDGTVTTISGDHFVDFLGEMKTH